MQPSSNSLNSGSADAYRDLAGPAGRNPYISITAAEQRAMLLRIGAGSVADLFADIPEAHRNPELRLPHPLSEQEILSELGAIAAENRATGQLISFLGGGAYQRYVPSVVAAIAGRSEFYTAYTPYQPEISQGTLQAAFEFQSMICELYGMDAANAGMYDGASALAEACLMATAVTGRKRIAVLDSIHPTALRVIQTYASGREHPVDVVTGADAISGEHACLAVQQPNFAGTLEAVQELGAATHAAGALYVVSADPISLGMLRPPGAYGADIAVGEGQSLGCGLNYGGPFLGLFSCREGLVRNMPGRIVGQTHDLDGRTAYVLTLQAREQHIRRERATSNICTSEQLLALAAAVYLAALGPQGLRQIAALCYHRAHYAAQQICTIPGYALAAFPGEEGGTAHGRRDFFQEFVVRCPRPPAELLAALLDRGIVGGLDVSDRFENGLLVAVTEMNPREQIDTLIEALADLATGPPSRAGKEETSASEGFSRFPLSAPERGRG
jgi:glycine dehydrogenase subunit 1